MSKMSRNLLDGMNRFGIEHDSRFGADETGRKARHASAGSLA
jgi:hypothetical protein